MARGKSKLDLTLFPFLSVLAGMIAVMMLFMMITLGTRVIGEEPDAEPESGPGTSVSLEVVEAQDVGDGSGIAEDQFEKLHQELQSLSGQLIDRIQRQKELLVALDQLEGLIEQKKNEIEVVGVMSSKPGKKLGQPTLVDVVPVRETGGPNKKIHFVEVSASGYLLHPKEIKFPPVTANSDAGIRDFTVDPAFKKFLEDIDTKRRTEFIVFLIHPNGATSFMNVLSYIDQRFPYRPGAADQYDVGWEPFSKDWKYSSPSK